LTKGFKNHIMKIINIKNIMSSLTINIKPKTSSNKKFLVEMDFDKLEKLATSLGFFSVDFLKSVDKAEKDYKEGKTKKIKSLKELKAK